jgi:hypothetical protein
MSNSVYTINKGINKSIEFKGLKAQYIWYFGAVIVVLLIVFAIMYIIGVNSFICIGIIMIGGTFMTLRIYALSNKYGEYGMMKKIAKRNIPHVIKLKNRRSFQFKK